MASLRLVHLDSPAALQAAAAAWDDLWQRSDATLPTLRAAPAAEWLERFAPGAEFHALAVEQAGRWIAALPLFRRRLAGLLSAAALPNNEWSAGGDLLLDYDAEVLAALSCLAGGLVQLGWPLAWFDEVELASRRWRDFGNVLSQRGCPWQTRVACRVGRLPIGPDWDSYRRSLSRKHRQRMASALRRLRSAGEVRLVTLADLDARSVAAALRRGFAVEDRSWKGSAGTSVLAVQGMFEFFVVQAAHLARFGQLELHFLESAGRPIAFVYGAAAKGVFHSLKVGYDAAFSAYGPGHLLRYLMLEQFHEDRRHRAVDFLGPMTGAHARWRPDSYPVGRLMAATGGPLGRALLGGYRRLWSPLRRVRRRRNAEPAVQASFSDAVPLWAGSTSGSSTVTDAP